METRIAKGYADTSIGQMHYRQAGEGRNLLLLHSTPSCSEVFEPLMRLLSPQGFRTIAVDNPGFGMSSWLPRLFTIGDVARVMIEVLDHLQIKTASIFGEHTGASAAVEIAATKPRRVEKLILSGPVNLDGADRGQRLAASFSSHPLLREDGSHLQALWEGLSRPRQTPPGWKPRSLEERHRSLVWRLNAEPRVIEYPHAVFSFDMAGRLPKVKAPALVMAGEYEPYISCVEPTARLLKGARQHTIVGGSFGTLLEQTEDIARVTRDFLLESVTAAPKQ